MSNKIYRTASIIIALALTFGTFTPGNAKSNTAASMSAFFNQPQVSALASVSTIVADADSRVHEANPSTNYGTYGTVLYVDGGTDPDIESYLRFTVTGISAAVTNAKLRIYLSEGSSNGPAVYATSNTWTETAITWSNRPAPTSGALDDKGALVANSWVEYEVTPIISGNGTYSFILATDSPDSIALSSREGSSAPQLVLTVADGTTSTLPTAIPQSTASPLPTVIQPTNTPAVTLPTITVIAPTATPITVLPSPTVIKPTTTPITVLPSPTAIRPTATSQNTTTQPTGSMWISSSELMSLPTSGSAWDRMRTAAYGSWGTPDLKDQASKHDINLLAGALVYARTGDASLRTKVRDGIIAAKRTLDESSEWQTSNGVLATGRQLGAYVISADLINLKSYDAAADNEFRIWLSSIRTTNIGTHSRWKNLKYTCENATANWSAFACASRIAASIYLGDSADVQRSSSIIRALLGERNYYPADAPGKNGYFEHTADYQTSWSCNETSWTGINPPCVKSGVNIDGALIEDASRGGVCCTLQGPGVSYPWEALQGLFVSAELLYRTGNYGNPYTWSNQGLKRAMDFMQRSGWGITSVATYVPWMANARYGTAYTKATSTSGRIMSWADWLYQK